MDKNEHDIQFSNYQRKRIIQQVSDSIDATDFTLNGARFFLDRYTLIPHPDTFQLIKIASDTLKANDWIRSFADVGTGSGIIGVSLANMFPRKNVLASDISTEALAIAKRNAVLHKARNVQFFQNTDQTWLSEFGDRAIDFIISNPPFVGEKEFSQPGFLSAHPEVALEPKSAVVTHGDDIGLSPYLDIIKNSKRTKTRMYLFQCNSENIQLLESKVSAILECRIGVIKDEAGSDRFLLITTG